MIQNFTLIEKKLIASDIYQMAFSGEKTLEMKPGQFITFLLDTFGGRAYSILELKGYKIILIIKRWDKKNGGRGGSMMICDLKVGESLRGVGPAGHFILQENNKNKMFIGTGTGFVPLYNQIINAQNYNSDVELKLFFGIRKKEDIFYEEELESLKKQNSNFDFTICLSRDEGLEYYSGYTTDLITQKNIQNFEEFYICGFPAMIESVIEKLKKLGINQENIFYEKY